MNTAPRSACVVGGGIVGLAVAARLLESDPERRVVVFEKESAIARHQTGRNSGVLHSGLYYRPGSSKALNCREGKALMEAFCAAERVPLELCGKVVVATDEAQLPALDELERRGRANGVDLERVDAAGLFELEPHARGIAALHVKEAGIVDYVAVCERLAARVTERGEVRTGLRVAALEPGPDGVTVRFESGAPPEHFDVAVNCAGLHCDRVARASGLEWPQRIVPFRGEYWELVPEARHLVRNLIYPTPDPRFPFLGVHFTRMTDGSVECGPNAVLALAREGYRWRDVSVRDTLDALSYRGFQRLAVRHLSMGLGEIVRSISKTAFVRALQRLVPAVRAEHLVRVPAGVRAQTLSPLGALVDDFVLQKDGAVVHVLNAPSPAATSSLAIARRVADLALQP
ncbi:L-2-hydroxyglutarate oxidase [Rohdeia mirabilis]|uniref:L-2-hydroxyglutarate oxidase n=1 Tax=Rohdeia mirabilis TaxID=2528008 RepID=UPI003AF38C10